MKETTKHRLVFWIRLVSWIAIGCVIPIVIFAHEFGLFVKVTVVYDELGNVVSKTNSTLNGWGIVSVLLIGSFLSSILKDVAEASSPGYSLIKQCYMGLSKTMPLIIAFAVCYFLSGVLDQAMYCLIVLIICKLLSTPINPLPKWKYEKLGNEDYSTFIEHLTDFVKKHSKESGGGS